MSLTDSWRFAVGTLTAWRVQPPRRLNRAVAGPGLVLAPLAVLPLGLAVTGVLVAGHELGLGPLAVAAVAVGVLALGSRALHLDGLADTADGLTASYDRDRALAVMRTGDVGPAGAVALVIVLGAQVAALASLATSTGGACLAGVLVCVSRIALPLLAVEGVRAARPEGLGATVAGSVPPSIAVAVVAAAASVTAAATSLTGGNPAQGLAALAVAVLVVVALGYRCVRRLGGITGDVLGAGVELALAALLVAST